jgi:hypothetical protein
MNAKVGDDVAREVNVFNAATTWSEQLSLRGSRIETCRWDRADRA